MNYFEAPIGRGQAIKTVAATAELARRPGLLAGMVFERNAAPEKEVKTAGIFGLHDTPNVGGSRDIEMAIEDTTRLGAKSLVMLDPSEQLIKDARDAGIAVIARAYLPGNRFNEEELTKLMKKLTRYVDHPLVQPFNEVNLPKETDWKALTPQQHALDFAKAADVIAKRGGKALLTPMAQKAPVNGRDYLEKFINAYLGIKSPSWIEKNNAIADHAYVFSPGKNPWAHVQNTHRFFSNVGLSLPIYVTEGGVHQKKEIPMDEEEVAQETIKLLETPVPSGLPVETFCFWVLSNFAQRPKDHEEEASEELKDFEETAWRRTNNRLSPVYRHVEAYTQETKTKPSIPSVM